MASDTPPSLPAQILARLDALIGRKGQFVNEIQNWAGGSAVGGDGTGRYPFTDAAGHQTLVESPAKIASHVGHNLIGPEYFGAIGDGQIHTAREVFPTLAACQAVYAKARSLAQTMDFLAWQKMVDTVGQYTCPPERTYRMCTTDAETWTPLDWCAGISQVDANYGTLDWQDLRFVSSSAHYLDNYNFATSDGWRNSTDYEYDPGLLIPMTFNKGYAEGIDNKDKEKDYNPYYEALHAVTLQPGRYRAVLNGTGTRGVSFKHGNGNPPYATMHFRGITGRSVTVFPSLDPVDPENVEVPFHGQFDFEVTQASSGDIVFKGGGYLNVKVRSMDIIQFIPNSAILHHRDGPIEHYFLARRLKNANLRGPYNEQDRKGISTCIWKSFASIDGSLQDWEMVKIENWDITLNWQDGAYLLNYFMCDVGGADSGCYFGAGSVNAGENIKFMQGSISGGKIAMRNPGAAEFTLDGTIIDYNEQFLIDNAGLVHIMNTRHEQHGPTDPAKPVIHCTTGRVIYMNSYILMAGGVGTAPTEPFWLDTTAASVECHGTQAYNLSSINGTAVKGPGTLQFYNFVNSGNPNIGPDLLSKSDNMDLLGGAGLFEPQAAGTDTFYNSDSSGINLEGGIVVSDPATTVKDRWTSTFLKASISTDYAKEGTRSLKITKLSRSDNNVYNQLQLLVPLPSRGNLLGVVYFAQPLPYTDPEIRAAYPISGPPVYFRQFYVRVIGYDVFNRPIISNRVQFKGEDDLYFGIDGSVNPDGTPIWTRKSLNTTYGQPFPDHRASDRSHAWATHYMIAIDMQVMPAGSIYMDGMRINYLG